MAHAAPAPRRMARQRRRPDVFSARTHSAVNVALPVALGLIYGLWAATNRRFGGPITGWNVLFGFVTALVFAVVFAVLWRLSPRLGRGPHALAWGVFAGCAAGFLVSQSNLSVYSSAGVGLVTGAGILLINFYRFYSREDPMGLDRA
ncbi:hypothetical protein ACFY3O_11380 [Streptomyces sp. NPDC001046]|uniref:hypothetical protein n=1 Tax=unclassified Streptomyces TaxID=2593676 RepID=UPI00367F127A